MEKRTQLVELRGNSYAQLPCLPSRELTYPTWGKGKSSSKVPWYGIFFNFQKGNQGLLLYSHVFPLDSRTSGTLTNPPWDLGFG